MVILLGGTSQFFKSNIYVPKNICDSFLASACVSFVLATFFFSYNRVKEDTVIVFFSRKAFFCWLEITFFSMHMAHDGYDYIFFLFFEGGDTTYRIHYDVSSTFCIVDACFLFFTAFCFLIVLLIYIYIISLLMFFWGTIVES